MIYDLATGGITLAAKPIRVSWGRQRTVRRIINEVIEHYGVSYVDFYSARRSRDVSWPRQVAMYLSRELTPKSLPAIGGIFKRDHTTVLHAVRKVEQRLANDDEFAADLNALRERLAA